MSKNNTTPKKKFKTQNEKVWTINFSKPRFVLKSQKLIPALKDIASLRSMGLTVMMAIEFCLQDSVVKDFCAYVNTRRRSLV